MAGALAISGTLNEVGRHLQAIKQFLKVSIMVNSVNVVFSSWIHKLKTFWKLLKIQKY